MAIEFDAVVPKPNLSANVVTTEITTAVQPDTGITTGVTTASITTATKIGNTVTSVSQPTFIATAAAAGPSEATAILFVRGLDQVTISDPAAITLRKPFSENIALLDSFFVSIIYNRSVLETVSTNDSVIYRGFSKVLSTETASVTDVLVTIGVFKNLSDTAAALEVAKFVATKPIFNSVSISDINGIITVTNYLRSFEDLVDATDDYYGAANIDDDEYATFTKVTIDNIENYELINKAVATKLFDLVVNTSEQSSNVGKIFANLVSFAEYNEYNIGKNVENLISLADTNTKYFERVSSDRYIVSDLFSRIINYIRDYSDDAYTQEVFVKLAYLNKQENISVAGDVFNTLVSYNRTFDQDIITSETTYYNASKYFTETNSLLDTNSNIVSKITSDSNNISDLFNTQIDYLRSFEDLVDATDDYYGVANIDDDEYVTFTKITVDTILPQDITAFNISTILNSIFTYISDPQSNNIGKFLNTQFISAETTTKIFDAVKVDSLAVTETKYFNFSSILASGITANHLFTRLLEYNRNFTEISNIQQDLAFFNIRAVKQHNISINDVFTRTVDYRPEVLNTIVFNEYLVSLVNKNLLNTNTIIETSAILTGKYLLNAFSISDAANTQVSYLRSFEDLVDATDDYYGAANIDDDEYASFTKVTVDSILEVDATIFDIAKILSDSATNLDIFAVNTSKPLSTQFNSAESNTKTINSLKLNTLAINELKYLSISSIVNNTITNTDLLATLLQYYRDFAEANIVQDLATIRTSIAKQHSIFSTDVFTRTVDYQRQLVDAGIFSEYTVALIDKTILNIGTITETSAILTSKYFSNNFGITDTSSTQVNYLRSFEDLVDATDDYYGAATIGDDEYASFSKVTVDNILQQDITRFDLAKILATISTNSITDISIYNTGKFLSTQFNSTESNTKLVYSTKLETVNTSEVRYVNIISILSSIVNNNDVFSRLLQYSRNIAETNNTEDLTTLNTSIVKQHSTIISDTSSSQVSYLRSFEDLIDATDDYYGAATIGDDEYASFVKVTIDTILQEDTAAFNVAKILSDNNTVTETSAYTTGKFLTNRINGSESNTKEFNSLKLNTFITTEINYFTITSVVNNTVTTTDLATTLLQYLRSFTETNTVEDLSIFSTNIVKQHSAGINDSFIKTIDYLRSFEDLVDATDDYYGAATIDDDEYASFTKVIADNILQLDVTKFNVANILADTADTIDSLAANTGKFLSTQFNSSETNTKLTNNLKLETLITSELSYFNIRSVLSSAVGITQTKTVTTGKYLSNIFSSSDTATTQVDYLRNFNNLINTTDSINYFDISQVLINTITITETKAITAGKYFSNAFSINDLFNTQVSYLRSFEDLVDATDDYYGAATVGDDEYASFVKVTVDSILQQDTTAFDITSILADSSNAIDSLAANTSKFLSTQFNSSETNNKTINSLKLDLINTNELKYFNISSVLSSTITNSDLLISLLQYLRNFTETSTTEDLAVFNTSIVKQDNVRISDLFNRLVNYNRNITADNTVTSEFSYYYVNKYLNENGNLLDTPAVFISKITSDSNSISDVSSNQINYLRSFEDLIDATDDYYGAATIGDDEYASFSKVTVDNILQQDTTAFNITSILADNSNPTDSLAANTGKFLTTQFNSSETNSKTISSLNTDSSNTNELKYFNISSVLSNNVNVTELFRSLVQYLRSFTEAVIPQEIVSTNTSIVKQHNANINDIFTRTVYYNPRLFDSTVFSEYTLYTINKNILDTGSISESKSATTSKYFSNAFSISDVSSNQVNYLRSFEDLIDATDDYYGAATVGDDEYASFVKVTVDSILQQDTAVFNITSILVDSSNATDSLAANTGKGLTTQFNSSETNSKTISSLNTDSSNTNELKYFNISSVLSNNVIATELFRSLLQYFRSFTETNITEDLAVFNTSIVKQHSVRITDLFSRLINYQPQLFDSIIFTEYILSLIDKNVVDILNINDSKAISANKYLLDILNRSDTTNTQVNYLRSFEDLVDATDDYYGAATIGDDEYASFTKVTVDSILQQDVTNFNIASILANSSTAIDTSKFSTGKYLTTQLNNSDTNTKVFSSLKSDYTNTNEINYFNTNSVINNSVINSEVIATLLQYLRNFTEIKLLQELVNIKLEIIKQDTTNINELFNKIVNYRPQLSDNLTFSEYKVFEVNKNTSDIGNTNDSKAISANKYLLDILNRSDTINTQINYSRNFQDQTDATDDYYGAATVGDDEYASFAKVTVDNATNIDINQFSTYKIFSDYRTLTTSDSSNNTIKPNKIETISPVDILTYYKFGGKTFTETIFSTDSGTINNQNYFASSYVTPGYAGTNTYFGT
jgi:hypothetical protein